MPVPFKELKQRTIPSVNLLVKSHLNIRLVTGNSVVSTVCAATVVAVGLISTVEKCAVDDTVDVGHVVVVVVGSVVVVGRFISVCSNGFKVNNNEECDNQKMVYSLCVHLDNDNLY